MAVKLLDGIRCKSMEVFLQSLKLSDAEMQIEVSRSYGKEGK